MAYGDYAGGSAAEAVKLGMGGVGGGGRSGGGGFLGLSGSQWSSLGNIGAGVGQTWSHLAQSKYYSASGKVNKKYAWEAVRKAKWQVGQIQREKQKWMGGARALFGWAGVDIEGSPTDVLAEGNREMTMDEMMTTREGYIQQQIYLAEAEYARKAAKAAKRSATMSGIGTAVGVGSFIGGLG